MRHIISRLEEIRMLLHQFLAISLEKVVAFDAGSAQNRHRNIIGYTVQNVLQYELVHSTERAWLLGMSKSEMETCFACYATYLPPP